MGLAIFFGSLRVNSLKSFRKFVGNIGRQASTLVTDLSQLLSLLTKGPLNQWNSAKKEASGFKLSDAIKWPWLLLVALISLILKVIISPAELLVGTKSNKEFLRALLGVAILSTSIGAIYWFAGSSNRANQLLRNSATAAFQKGDYKTAALEYQALAEANPKMLPADRFQWALALLETKNLKQATTLLDQLAPATGEGGFPPAHELVAVKISGQLMKPISPVQIQTLRRHLKFSGDVRSPQLNRAWAEYYRAINQPANAVGHMEEAAKTRPEYFVILAQIHESTGNTYARKKALENARKFFHHAVEKQPTNTPKRLVYAKVLCDLEQFDDAEQTLLEGLKVNKDPKIKTACTDFYLTQFRKAKETEFAERFQILRKSLSFDSGYLPAYQEIIRFYRVTDKSDRRKISSVLLDALEKNESPALTNFAYSNMLWIEGKTKLSQKYMERAFDLDSQFAVIANNLAWLLAHRANPDLDRAEEIAGKIVEHSPENGRFRDTLGTILMKQGSYDQAIAEFQQALSSIPDKKEVHRKMATSYRALKMTDLADQHQSRAETQ